MDRLARAALTLTDSYATVVVRPPIATSRDAVICRSWDLGAPEVRNTPVARSGADGTDVGAGYLGARSVTLDLVIFGDPDGVTGGHGPYWYAEQLAGFTHPLRSPVLQITRGSDDANGQLWSLALRGTPFSISYGSRAASLLEMQLNFTAPLGLLESPLNSLSSSQISTALATDWHFPAAFPHTFGLNTGGPSVSAVVTGSAPSYPVIYLNGPATNPEVRDSTGNRFVFSGLTLGSGQTVQIDMQAGTVLLADPTTGVVNVDADIYHTVNFAVSSFWRWLPGTYQVSYIATTGSMVVQWRDRRFTI